MRHTAPRLLATLPMILVSGTAFAHPGHGASGFAAGLAHPMQGLDHLLAMAAVALWGGTGRRHKNMAAARRLYVHARGRRRGRHVFARADSHRNRHRGLGAGAGPARRARAAAADVVQRGGRRPVRPALRLRPWAGTARIRAGGCLCGRLFRGHGRAHLSGIAVGIAARRHQPMSRIMGVAIAASGAYLLVGA